MGFQNFSIKKIINTFLTIWLIIILIYRIIICFSYKTELSNGESNNIWKAINISVGKPIYNNPEKLPLEIFQYTPLSIIPLSGIACLFDENSTYYVHYITICGRLIQLLFNIIMLYFIYKLCHQFIRIDKQISYFISIISLTLLTHPAFAIRPDSMLILFIIITIYTFTFFLNSDNKIIPVIIGIFITFCFFIKQDGIFISIPLGLFLIIERKWRKMFILSGYSLIIFSITIITSQIIFGNFLMPNIIKGLNNPISYKQLISVFDRAYSFYAIHIVIGLTLTIFYLTKKYSKLKLISILSLFYFILAITTSIKLGSWVNYYTPFILFSTILIIYFLKNIKINNSNKILPLNAIVSISMFSMLSLLFTFKQIYTYTSPYISNYNFYKRQYLKSEGVCEQLKTQYKIKRSDSILTISPLDKMFLASNSILVNIEYYHLSDFNYTNFKNKRNKGISYILLRKNELIWLKHLSTIFNIDLSDYKSKNIMNYILLTPKTLI